MGKLVSFGVALRSPEYRVRRARTSRKDAIPMASNSAKKLKNLSETARNDA